jgi:hypothetical protein
MASEATNATMIALLFTVEDPPRHKYGERITQSGQSGKNAPSLDMSRYISYSRKHDSIQTGKKYQIFFSGLLGSHKKLMQGRVQFF